MSIKLTNNYRTQDQIKYITPQELYNFLPCVNEIIYSNIIDVRSKEEYEQSHIMDSYFFDFDDIVNLFVYFADIFPSIKKNFEKNFILIDDTENIPPLVIYDGDMDQPSPRVQTMLDIAQGYGPAAEICKFIKILDGGFQNFYKAYSYLCVPFNNNIIDDISLNGKSHSLYPSCIIPGFLYLGGERCSVCDILKNLNIVFVVNLAEECDIKVVEGVTYMPIRELKDTPTDDIFQHFIQVNEFLDEVKKRDQRVLVHCQAGVSRSATIVISYIMKSQQWPIEKALKFVKARRGIIEPNYGFINQLKQYQTNLNIKD